MAALPLDDYLRAQREEDLGVGDTIDRVPQTGDKGIDLRQQLKDKLVEHKQYIDKNGQDLPEIRNWKWGTTQ